MLRSGACVLSILLAAAAIPAEPPTGELVLVPGKFGNALDARAAPASIDGIDEFRHPPLTVECWAKLFSKSKFNAIVAHDFKTAADHWELYTRPESGSFAAYLPGVAPTDTDSGVDVCDGRWHYLA